MFSIWRFDRFGPGDSIILSSKAGWQRGDQHIDIHIKLFYNNTRLDNQLSKTVNPLNLQLLNKTKNIALVCTWFPIKSWGKLYQKLPFMYIQYSMYNNTIMWNRKSDTFLFRWVVTWNNVIIPIRSPIFLQVPEPKYTFGIQSYEYWN